jgi:hypothetical protein
VDKAIDLSIFQPQALQSSNALRVIIIRNCGEVKDPGLVRAPGSQAQAADFTDNAGCALLRYRWSHHAV